LLGNEDKFEVGGDAGDTPLGRCACRSRKVLKIVVSDEGNGSRKRATFLRSPITR
jgi:hypothetical protein